MTHVSVSQCGAVRCTAQLELPMSAITVWGQLRDFHRFAQQDLFHANIVIDGAIPRAGARLRMTHRYAGLRIDRVGRILVWRENVGYSFSDLSLRGPRRGFPHVFSYRLEATGPGSCRLHVAVRGLWTNRLTAIAARPWLRWVFGQVVRSIRNELLLYQLWRQRRGAIATREFNSQTGPT
jgi:hypothetical protein